MRGRTFQAYARVAQCDCFTPLSGWNSPDPTNHLRRGAKSAELKGSMLTSDGALSIQKMYADNVEGEIEIAPDESVDSAGDFPIAYATQSPSECDRIECPGDDDGGAMIPPPPSPPCQRDVCEMERVRFTGQMGGAYRRHPIPISQWKAHLPI